ncbi:hypothetical protein [Desulfatitalea tepidiphila]|uniref:hypothetical protein n=1 Tax=Desulfatitalea tepidiphila TaxID=1185843 RepID=UPI00128F713F|nr:hypothetical protein [Desulfatitalea tepidiphila]
MRSIFLRIFELFFIIMISGNIVYAKDLYVSQGGNDNYSYEQNDISHPWRTVSRAFSSVNPGDTVYFTQGEYPIQSTIETKSNPNPSSSSNRVLFTNYSNQTVSFISSVNRAIYIDRDYYEVQGIAFTGPGTFWYIGNTNNATHFKISDCRGVLTGEGGSENIGLVRFQAARASYGQVENCDFTGPNRWGNINTAGVFVFRSQGIKVFRTVFNNFPRAIYYKHTCIPENTGIEFAYNYFYNNSSGIVTVSQYADIHDNLFVNCGMLIGEDGGTGDDGSNAGGDHNIIRHNTFYGGAIQLIRSSSNDGSGAQYNTMRDNVFSNTVEVFRYGSWPHYSTLHHNLYPSGTAVINNRVNYNLSSWQSYFRQDDGSLSGELTFVGGDSPSSIEGFALNSTSLGYRAASDGKDMGADISAVGLGSSTPVEPTPTPVPISSSNPPFTPQFLAVEIDRDVHSNAILFQDDFDGPETMTDKYIFYNSNNGDCAVVSGIGVGATNGLRVRWNTGQVDAGSFWYMFGRNPVASKGNTETDFREIYWRFYLKTSEGWTGNPFKLTRATSFARSDWSQAMVAHLWGEDGDTVIKMDPATGISGNSLATSGYNDFNGLTWLGAKKGGTPIYDSVMSNSWHLVEIHVKLNTPGLADGVFECWIDGRLEGGYSNLDWTGEWQEYGINAILFGNYWNGGAPGYRERYLDNIVISTAPIGPVLSPVNPTLTKSGFEDPDSGDSQGGFEVQVSSSKGETGLVWAGETLGDGNSLTVNSSTGEFQGALAGNTKLHENTVYFIRVRQSDSGGNNSEWSYWSVIKTVVKPPENLKMVTQ